MGWAKNKSGGIAKFEIGQRAGRPPRAYSLRAGEVIELDDGYVHQPNSPNGRRGKSIIEHLTGGRVVPCEAPTAKGSADPFEVNLEVDGEADEGDLDETDAGAEQAPPAPAKSKPAKRGKRGKKGAKA